MTAPKNDQLFPAQSASVYIVKNANGRRAAKVTQNGNVRFVPVELLAMAAGKDTWMREIKFKCSECRQYFMAKEMECELCEACLAKIDAENEKMNS